MTEFDNLKTSLDMDNLELYHQTFLELKKHQLMVSLFPFFLAVLTAMGSRLFEQLINIGNYWQTIIDYFSFLVTFVAGIKFVQSLWIRKRKISHLKFKLNDIKKHILHAYQSEAAQFDLMTEIELLVLFIEHHKNTVENKKQYEDILVHLWPIRHELNQAFAENNQFKIMEQLYQLFKTTHYIFYEHLYDEGFTEADNNSMQADFYPSYWHRDYDSDLIESNTSASYWQRTYNEDLKKSDVISSYWQRKIDFFKKTKIS